MGAKAAAERVISPLVPDGTLGWLAFPAHGESVQAFARRAVGVAAARSSWAGGLSDGTHDHDAAVVHAAVKLVGGARR